jgi:hypothetical protein
MVFSEDFLWYGVPVLLLVNLGMILGGIGKCNVIGKKEKRNKNST